MSDIMERHKELSKKVLISGESKFPGQKTPNQVQPAPKQLMYVFFLGAIVGFFIFVAIGIIAGFSKKLAIMLPFIGGFSGVAVEMIRRKYKA
ncbi:MAG: hypothetical protein ACK41Q_08570 [Candidatus Brocadia sp.]